ncbi:hypothetical protein M413DRAFT_30270 [Hebeloma cylindrosporum]|uniref:Uncharacterized protein n=1 Tax=Hebeloma cylindrosporum TaxID=76867 RepID=A0A0C2XK61_HEBCY|nr:hypothetical protein M413DRAFT_30270 [Hebeloma cylindrosporum h7]
MDGLFLQLSSSPPVLPTGIPGLLPDLESLELYSAEGYEFDRIPDIFGLPHRKMLNLEVDTSPRTELDEDTRRKISHLIDQGCKIHILRAGKNYFDSFGDEMTGEEFT